jgi:DNA polymerase I-like protein with 3'-5' exonuclease and polymerase domains
MSTKGNGSYWRPEEEAQILQAMIPVLLFCPLTFHNGNFDAQYIAKQWGIIPNLDNDTMIAQHVLMPGLLGGKLDPVTGVETKKGSSRSLAFVSSMYCRYHRYWKDEGRKWDPRIHPEEQHWTYNCEDCVRTNEAMGVLREALDKTGLWWQYRFLISLFKPTMKMMLRGVLIDQAKRREIRTALDEAIALRLSFIRTATSCPHFNPNSKDHMSDFFYGDMRQRKILHRKTKQPTLDDNALDTIRRREPLLAPVIDAIREIRSLGVLKNTFIEAPLCSDGRMRTSFNLAGPETFRLSSNQTAFGEGTNLQNIPKPQEYL